MARARACSAADDTRCPSAWEPVHGHIEPGEEPEQAAVREVREESGLAVERLYNVRVQPFYFARTRTLQLAIVFAAFVDEPTPMSRSAASTNRPSGSRVDDALPRFAFPASERRCARSSSSCDRRRRAGRRRDARVI